MRLSGDAHIVRACVIACVRACVRVCVRACMHARLCLCVPVAAVAAVASWVRAELYTWGP